MTQFLPSYSLSSQDTPNLSPASRSFLPDGVAAFLRRRGYEASGLALMTAAVMLGTALFTYAPGDPSFNSASDFPVQNVMGAVGALTADLLLQIFGIASFLASFVLFAWGWRILHKQAIDHAWFRFIALITGIICISVTLGGANIPKFWPLVTGLGGVTGSLILTFIDNGLQLYKIPQSLTLIRVIGFALALPPLFWSLGLNLEQWQRSYQGVAKGLRTVTTGVVFGYHKVRHLFARSSTSPDQQYLADSHETDEISVRVSVNGGSSSDDDDQTGFRSGLVESNKAPAKKGKKAKAAQQPALPLENDGQYELPPLHLLDDSTPTRAKQGMQRGQLEQNAKFLATVLADFGIKGEIVKVRPGPVVTLYELEPAPGTKTSRVIGLSDDIARSMSAVSVRIAVVPGRSVIGIEMPNITREMVHLRELLASEVFEKATGNLRLALGKDIAGNPVATDLSRMPHLLIAGTTGSGKSVAMNTMILSLLYSCTPDQCKLIMIDPKMLELSVYEGIPHLLTPVVTDPAKAVIALKWTVREMEDRYRAMSQLGVRNIAGYNSRLAEAHKKGEILFRTIQTGFDDDGKPIMEDQPIGSDPLPNIVVVVDEMADLMLVAGKDVEAAIQRLAQMARAAGIHLIMATQRPSVDVITGTIKANFPTRISFQVTSKIDSRTILGEQGAEQLLGQGDMLFMAGGGRISRIHGPFVSDEEVENVVNHLKSQARPDYIEEVTVEDTSEIDVAGGGNATDELYDKCVALIAHEGKASTSFIQRHMQIGYNRAARIIEQMEKEGVVSPANRVGRREVLIGNH